MAYLLGAVIPDNKIISVALQKIYGVGVNKSKLVCKNIGLSNRIRTFELKENKSYLLAEFVENSGIIIKSDLVRSIISAEKRLLHLRVYRGIRAKQGFPIRGQRTHTNAKTAKKKFNKN